MPRPGSSDHSAPSTTRARPPARGSASGQPRRGGRPSGSSGLVWVRRLRRSRAPGIAAGYCPDQCSSVFLDGSDDCTACKTRLKVLSSGSCSHTRMTLHPAAANRRVVSRSRSTLAWSLARHQSALDLGQVPRAQGRHARSSRQRTPHSCLGEQEICSTPYPREHRLVDPVSESSSMEPSPEQELGRGAGLLLAGHPAPDLRRGCHWRGANLFHRTRWLGRRRRTRWPLA
jgi:hypothetical protein